MNLYKTLFRPYLFSQDPEKIHERTLRFLKLIGKTRIIPPILAKVFRVEDPKLEIKIFGLNFKNPVGLAAGFDKDGQGIGGLGILGFSHLELGTVTPLLQEGNPRPRIFRLTRDQALINRMGFPGLGARNFVKNLKNRPKTCLLGVNIGKGKNTPVEKAEEDYLLLLKKVYSLADYIAINVSSPNTVGLRQLQAKKLLKNLTRKVKNESQTLAQIKKIKPKPLLLKIAPDLTWPEIDDIIEVIRETGIDGLIATNTTTGRLGLKSKNQKEPGGLSGRPLKRRSTEIIRYIYKKSHGEIPIIGVGGVASAADVLEKIKAGASLVQVYTGLIYEGPAIVKRINQDLVIYLNKKRIKSIQELVGQDVV